MRRLKMSNLKRWPNGLGYTFRDWDLMKDASGTWTAVCRPKWFGGVSRVGKGDTYRNAIMAARFTEEYKTFTSRQANRLDWNGVTREVQERRGGLG
jgi:hypothetical protein